MSDKVRYIVMKRRDEARLLYAGNYLPKVR